MSAVGSYAVVNRDGFQTCLARAREIHSETTGKWLFKKTEVVGQAEFGVAWTAALVREVDFGYSGYALGNYLDAQEMINGVRLVDEESETSTLLAKAFTAGFAFDQKVTLPELTRDKLLEYGREEYGEGDAAGFAEAVTKAHSFYLEGLGEINSDNLVVFLIR
jgi:hypothetical protein